MFAVDHVLVSDDLLDAPFACRGGCLHGYSGAPLDGYERPKVDAR